MLCLCVCVFTSKNLTKSFLKNKQKTSIYLFIFSCFLSLVLKKIFVFVFCTFLKNNKKGKGSLKQDMKVGKKIPPNVLVYLIFFLFLNVSVEPRKKQNEKINKKINGILKHTQK